MKKNDFNFYYSGGLAELVNKPTSFTFKYIKKWFSGNACLGHAYSLLNLPYNNINLCPLEIIEDEMVVNLKKENEIIYAKTLFSYKSQNDINSTPSLKIDIQKINLINIINTVKIILVQSRWLANEKNVIDSAKKLLVAIPDRPNKLEPESALVKKVFPNVIAIGIISEFFYQVLMSESKNQKDLVQKYIDQKLSSKDWFFKSVTDMHNVKTKKMSFDAYIKKYGVRADKDYELTQPRWHEIPDTIIKRIENSTKSFNEYEQVNIENKKLLKLANTCYKLQVIRSQAKMKALINIDAFRTDLLNKKILKREYKNNITKVTEKDTKRVDFGKGIGVSIGIVEAKAIHINNSNDKLPNNIIGIFNNASPEFSTLYNKCKGIIFLKGGATSHGAIVAREFGIPAIISSEAEGIKDNENIKINGATGEWKKV